METGQAVGGPQERIGGSSWGAAVQWLAVQGAVGGWCPADFDGPRFDGCGQIITVSEGYCTWTGPIHVDFRRNFAMGPVQ